MTTTTCRELVNAGSRQGGYTCGRPVSPDDPDGKLCGRHLTTARKQRERDAAYNTAYAEDRARRDAAEAACTLLATVGISATPAWRPNLGGKRRSPLPSTHSGGVEIASGSMPLLLARLGVTTATAEDDRP